MWAGLGSGNLPVKMIDYTFGRLSSYYCLGPVSKNRYKYRLGFKGPLIGNSLFDAEADAKDKLLAGLNIKCCIMAHQKQQKIKTRSQAVARIDDRTASHHI